MNDPQPPSPRLALAGDRLELDGTPAVLLCSSVFPFRLPADQWEHRLDLVRDSGYRMIDLYVHWGFHEQEPGVIDLDSEQRDLRRFLDLAQERELLVMARPGPYICSETDGGGLPWWLHGDAPTAPSALRTTDPDYLAAVDRWFGAVMPVLADAQTTRGGPVALVQIENELDFFDCPDPEAYMTHLADRAREAGIEVPLIACAGQGDLAGASGDAPGVVPTVNLYPADSSTTFDEETRHYARVLGDRDLPLLVTETNRVHRTLRREILAGARLVAPYLQTSGFDHLVLPSAGNWGDPGNLMTHDYDFDGYLTPEGRRRPEYDEARDLTATLTAWGGRLAAAAPVPLDASAVTDAAGEPVVGGALALPGGGTIVGPAALGAEELPVRLRSASGIELTASVPAGACPFWALDVPLDPWGAPGTLRVATAELTGVDSGPEGLTLSFTGGDSAEVRLAVPTAGGGEELLELRGPGRAAAVQAAHAVSVSIREPGPRLADPEPVLHAAGGELLPAPAVEDLLDARPVPEGALPGAEALRLADGRVAAELEVPAGASGLLLLGAADLVRVVVDSADGTGGHRGVHGTHGAPIRVPLGPASAHRVQVTAEIWGRANFDDARLPALRLGAGRGLGTVLAIHGSTDLTDLWEVRELPDRRAGGRLDQPPLRGLGGWSSANPGRTVRYGRTLPAPAEGNAQVLVLHGISEPVRVAVGGEAEQLVTPGSPVVLLPSGGPAEVEVLAPHVPGGLLERVELLAVRPPRVTALRTAREEDLAARLTERAPAAGAGAPLPREGLRLDAGERLLVRLDAAPAPAGPGRLLELAGEDVEVTVLVGGRRVSRHVLGAPAVSGGDAHRSWIPAGWSDGDPDDVLLLVEALGAGGGMFGGARRAAVPR